MAPFAPARAEVVAKADQHSDKIIIYLCSADIMHYVFGIEATTESGLNNIFCHIL